MEQPLSHRACAKLGRANDAMDGHHQHVEQDEAKEIKRILCDVIRHCLQSSAEVAVEFQLNRAKIKTISSINSFVSNENVPLFDHRDEDCCNDGTQPSQHEEHVSQQEDDFPHNIKR